MDSNFNVSHLRREVRTSLELALAALAPQHIAAPLAQAAGFFEALSEFPADSPAVLAILERARVDAQTALTLWDAWRREHLSAAA